MKRIKYFENIDWDDWDDEEETQVNSIDLDKIISGIKSGNYTIDDYGSKILIASTNYDIVISGGDGAGYIIIESDGKWFLADTISRKVIILDDKDLERLRELI